MSSQPYDLFSPRFKADPFPTYAAMRRDDPVYPHAAPDGTTIWYITRYDDVMAVLRDDTHFTKNAQAAQPDGTPAQPRRGLLYQLINDNMLFSDPPDHTRLRALVNQTFTPRRITALEGRIETAAHALIDTFAPTGETDLMTAYALPLPVVVISDMLGIPAADRTSVAHWSQAIVAPGSRGLTFSARKQQVRHFLDYLRVLFAERQAAPQDDLISDLVLAEEAGDRLTEAELFSMVALLMVTGHETTVNLIGNGALALLRHPQQAARLLAEPALWPAAVEEILRYGSPVETSTGRWVRTDVSLRGQLLRRGDRVRVVVAAANRDPAQFAQPDTFDIDRPDNKHLAFGLGTHYCLGAPLARQEGIIGLSALWERLPTLALATPAEALAWRSGVLFRGLESLPVTTTSSGR